LKRYVAHTSNHSVCQQAVALVDLCYWDGGFQPSGWATPALIQAGGLSRLLCAPSIAHLHLALSYPPLDVRASESQIVAKPEDCKFVLFDKPINGGLVAMQILGDVMDFHHPAAGRLGGLGLMRHHFIPNCALWPSRYAFLKCGQIHHAPAARTNPAMRTNVDNMPANWDIRLPSM